MPYAVSTAAITAPHRNNAALPNQSPYQQRTTQKDNPTQQLIKQAVDFLLQQLAAGKSETLTSYLAAMARFHSYSFGNILAIARQRPTASRVAGFSTWKGLGRFVKKGEKGTQILAPMMGHRRRKDDADQTSDRADAKPVPVLIGFRSVYVFERLSRDLWPRFYSLDQPRRTPRCPTIAVSHIIARFNCLVQRPPAIVTSSPRSTILLPYAAFRSPPGMTKFQVRPDRAGVSAIRLA
jgi:hypothetical protein